MRKFFSAGQGAARCGPGREGQSRIVANLRFGEGFCSLLFLQ